MLIAVAFLGCGHKAPSPEERNVAGLAAKQTQVVERGRSVMPFDIDRTMHHFIKLPSGGVQQVLSTDGDPHQIALVREHLRTEAIRFHNGDFSDPSKIHGPEMAGLSSLAAGASRIAIRYKDIAGGAQISYVTSDPALVTAIHTWFDAQVREHGHHAMPM